MGNITKRDVEKMGRYLKSFRPITPEVGANYIYFGDGSRLVCLKKGREKATFLNVNSDFVFEVKGFCQNPIDKKVNWFKSVSGGIKKGYSNKYQDFVDNGGVIDE